MMSIGGKALLFLAAAAACSGLFAVEPGIVAEDAATLRYRQGNGVEVTLRKNPKRTAIGFISLVPVWYCAGGEAVAVPTHLTRTALPEKARDLPDIGVFNTLNPEKIAALSPDLVLLVEKLNSHQRLQQQLASLGIASVCVRYNNYHDFRSLLTLFSKLNGRDQDGDSEGARIEKEVDAVIARTAHKPPQRYVVLFAAAAGFSVENDEANTGAMLKLLHGVNAAGTRRFGRGVRAPFSFEELLLLDPDVIFVITMGKAPALRQKFEREIAAQEAWKSLRAARAGRVHFLPADLFLYVPGTRFPEAFRHLEKLLYPEPEKTP